jgi:ABC-2 type transport system permease protein
VILNIAAFELRRLFTSPLAWFVLAVIQFIVALIFYNLLSAYMMQQDMFQGRGLTEIVVAGYFQGSGLLFVMLTPFLTMRLISEEIRSGTIKLLLSSPVTSTQIILGKFLAIVLFLYFIITVISLLPASLAAGTELDYGQFISGLIGVMLLTSSLISIGLFISTLFRYTAICAISTFAVLFLLWTIHSAGYASSEKVFQVLNYLSMYKHFLGFTQGMVSSTDLLYFIIITTLFLVLGIWRIDSLRTHHW